MENFLDTCCTSADKSRVGRVAMSTKEGKRKETEKQGKRENTGKGLDAWTHLCIHGGPADAAAEILKVSLGLPPQVLLHAVPELALAVAQPQVLHGRQIGAVDGKKNISGVFVARGERGGSRQGINYSRVSRET